MAESKIPTDIRKRIDEYDRNVDKWSYYEILYVTRNASLREIKRGYRTIVQLMHPDRHGLDLNPEYKSKLERIFNEINIAYNTLQDESERARYDSSLYYAEDHGLPVKADSDAQIAKAQYQRGIKALKKKEIDPAIEFFKFAIKLVDNVPEYHAKLAYALSIHPNPRVRTDAQEACKEAIKLDHENANYHALMGHLYQVVEDYETAEVHYRRALSWDPQHHKSRQEIKNIAFQKDQKKQAKSVLRKISTFLKAKPTKTKEDNQSRRTPRSK